MKFFDVINWKVISVFGKNKIINRSFLYLFIVPVFAKILSKVQSPLSLNFGGSKIEVVLDLPFSWKLFFFSALFFTLAAILYHFISPTIIKDNNSFGDFLNDKKNFTHLYRYMEELGITDEWIKKVGVETGLYKSINFVDKIYSSFDYYKTGWRRKSALTKIEIHYYISEWMTNTGSMKEQRVEDAFWLLFRQSNKSRKIWLIFTSLMYLAGFILISIVLIQSIIEVIKWV